MQLEITIVKWREYNPESARVRTPHWFRISKNIVNAPSLFLLTAQQKWFWICLMAMCCDKNSHRISVPFLYLQKLSGLEEKESSEALEILQQNGTIKYALHRSAESTTQIRESTHHTITLHNNNKTEEIHMSSDDDGHPLVEIWNQHCKALPKVKELNPKRKKRCKELWSKNKDPEHYKNLIGLLARHEFSNGHNNTGWIANFDYFIRPETQIKLIEGALINKPKPKSIHGFVER